VGALLAAMGVEATEVTSYSRDQGVDVHGELVVADVIRRPVAVQVKHWRTANVRAPAVRELRGSLGPHEIGLIITSRGFSEGAVVEAQRTDVTPIALMGGDELIDALIRYDIGVRKRDVELLEVTAFDLAAETADGEDDTLL
jgi:restriction system protein